MVGLFVHHRNSNLAKGVSRMVQYHRPGCAFYCCPAIEYAAHECRDILQSGVGYQIPYQGTLAYA